MKTKLKITGYEAKYLVQNVMQRVDVGEVQDDHQRSSFLSLMEFCKKLSQLDWEHLKKAKRLKVPTAWLYATKAFLESTKSQKGDEHELVCLRELYEKLNQITLHLQMRLVG